MSATVIFISKDIFFWPVIKSAVQEVGCQLIIVSTYDNPKLDAVVPGATVCCVADLSNVESEEVQVMVDTLRARFGPVSINGFASHVHEGKIQAAVIAGFNQVVSKGQFSAYCEQYLRKWLQ